MYICVPFEFDCFNGLNLSLLKISLYILYIAIHAALTYHRPLQCV